MTTTAVDLLDALRAHLAEFEVPQLCSVHASIHGPSASAQLRCHDAPELAAGLLAWADTLAEPAAGVWRVPDGDSVHFSITGRLSGGVSVDVYGGVPFTARGLGGDLAPGAKAPVLLSALRHVATLGEMTV